MFGVLGIEKSALVVIEPPGEPGVAAIFEIDNGIFVAIEEAGVEHLRRFMRHPGVAELRVGMDRSGNEAAEESSRGCPVKTVIVIQHAFQHGRVAENLPACLKPAGNASAA